MRPLCRIRAERILLCWSTSRHTRYPQVRCKKMASAILAHLWYVAHNDVRAARADLENHAGANQIFLRRSVLMRADPSPIYDR